MRISRGVAEVRGLVMKGAKHPGITSNYRRIESALREIGYAHEHAGRVFANSVDPLHPRIERKAALDHGTPASRGAWSVWEWALMRRVGVALEKLRVPSRGAA